MHHTTNALTEFNHTGKYWLRNILNDAELATFDTCADLATTPGQRLNMDAQLAKVLSSTGRLAQALAIIEPDVKPVRIVAFNKSQKNNWGVPWHQDRVISVAAKHKVEGFGNWTRKSGHWHCEPPKEILERMLFVRIHLDHADRSNGAMQIALGSHKDGVIASAKAKEIAERYPQEFCEAQRGDVLILKMLTLHSSKPSSRTDGRRVFRVDFASFDLPSPLNWATD